MNSSVIGNHDVGRVRGSSGTLANNYARADMTLPADVTAVDDADADGRHGETITAVQWWGNKTWWETPDTWDTIDGTAWDFSDTGAWEWNASTGLPILRGLGQQNHEVLYNNITLPDNFTQENLQDAVNNIKPGGVITLPNIPGAAGMELDSTITVDKKITITTPPEKNVTLTRPEAAFPAFTVESGGKLILLPADDQTITVRGDNEPYYIGGQPLIQVNAGGELEINNGVFITDTFTNNQPAILVDGAGSKLTMNGGEISNHTRYAPLRILNGGSFVMSGGIITGNVNGNHSSGSVILVTGTDNSGNGSSFTMTGGEISGNITSSSPPGGGGAIRVNNNASFIMEGGVIRNNYLRPDGVGAIGNGGAVYVQAGGTFRKTGNSIIYGIDAKDDLGADGKANWNRVLEDGTGADGSGHAVYIGGATPRFRDTTAGEDVDLDSGSDDGWGE